MNLICIFSDRIIKFLFRVVMTSAISPPVSNAAVVGPRPATRLVGTLWMPLKREGSVIQEVMEGSDLVVIKPLRFRVSVS